MSRVLGNIRGDKVIWAVVILLSIFSLLTVYSSTGTLAYKYQSGNTEYYMMKHLIILLFGFLIMYLTHLIKFTYFSRIFQVALYIAIPLLVLTLIVGLDLNEAKRVLPLPFGLTFQTSDLAKLTLIMYLKPLGDPGSTTTIMPPSFNLDQSLHRVYWPMVNSSLMKMLTKAKGF